MTDLYVAESGIRQLHARCIDAVWRKDIAAFADCFTDKGEWKIVGLHARGRREIGRTLEQLLSPSERVIMLMGIPVLEVGEGTVCGRVSVHELVKRRDNQGLCTIGIYYERYVCEGAQWRFLWRHFDLHYSGPKNLSDPFNQCGDYGPPPGMPGPDAPTTIRHAE